MRLKWGAVGVFILLILTPAGRGAAQEAEGPSDATPTPIDAILSPPPTETPTVQSPPVPSAPPPPTPEPPVSLPPAPLPSPAAEVTATPAPAPIHVVPRIARTPPRNTAKLVELLSPLTEWGPSIEDVLQEGMDRFPVKGQSYYSDDWLAARYNPTFHLHRGVDIFADFGTPVRAPTAGVVTRIASAGPGGNSVTILGGDDTTYYFAHLSSAAEGLEVGQSVELGTLLGYVGNTGNASGGLPHLHFEIRENGTAIPPKPIIDGWLDQAELAAGDFIEAQRLVLELER